MAIALPRRPFRARTCYSLLALAAIAVTVALHAYTCRHFVRGSCQLMLSVAGIGAELRCPVLPGFPSPEEGDLLPDERGCVGSRDGRRVCGAVHGSQRQCPCAALWGTVPRRMPGLRALGAGVCRRLWLRSCGTRAHCLPFWVALSSLMAKLHYAAVRLRGRGCARAFRRAAPYQRCWSSQRGMEWQQQQQQQQ